MGLLDKIHIPGKPSLEVSVALDVWKYRVERDALGELRGWRSTKGVVICYDTEGDIFRDS